MNSKIRYQNIDSFIRNTIKKDSRLKELEEYAEKYHVPIIQPEVAAFLRVIGKMQKPKKILEVGTAIGYSAILFSEFLQENGRIDTIEISEKMFNIAKKNIQAFQLDKTINPILGDALEVMSCLESKYDMIFIDASKGQYNEFYIEAERLLSNGGLLVSDNILYRGLVAKEELVGRKHRTITVRLKKYLNSICSTDKFDSSIIPIGDGVAISYKK